MTYTEQIQILITSGITPSRLAKESGVPENTVRRIFNGEAKINNIALANAEKLSRFYDNKEQVLAATLATIDFIAQQVFENSRVNPITYPGALFRMEQQPLKSVYRMHEMISEPAYTQHLANYQVLLDELTVLMDQLDDEIYQHIKLTGRHHYHMSIQREKLRAICSKNGLVTA